MAFGGLTTSLNFFPGRFWFNVLATIAIACAAYKLSEMVFANDTGTLATFGILLLTVAALVAILKDWRRGLYLFLPWILFEDLVRKYLGNNVVMFFSKDVLILAVYFIFFGGRRAERLRFRPPFWVPFVVFLFWCVIEAFNPESNSVLYGLLGLKLCFWYFPLIFLGYALVESESDVSRFLLFNSSLTLIIAGLGIAQSIIGPSFLNPSSPDDYIAVLSNTFRFSDAGLAAYRPTSVFVSTGRFQDFLLVSWPISLGSSAYLSLTHKRGRIITIISAVTVLGASLMAVSRGVFLINILSCLVAICALCWGVPRIKRHLERAVKVTFTLALLGAILLGALTWFYPNEVQSRLDVYAETLLPSSPHSELISRSRDYPWNNFILAVKDRHWMFGYGTGTSSLGIQYITRVFNIARMKVGVESGYGQLVFEVGVIGLLLWLICSICIALSAWSAARRLKGTILFPLAFSIFWYAFLLLIPMAYFTFLAFQDYVMNAYLWLLLGILYKLPKLLPAAKKNPSRNTKTADDTTASQNVVPA